MDDLMTASEAELIGRSQALKAEMAALRERRRAIARELERREEERALDAKLGELSDAEKARLLQRLAPAGAGARR
jgi:hypothetical protein